MTIIFSTHHIEEAVSLCNIIYIISNGEVAACGTEKEIVKNLTVKTLKKLLFLPRKNHNEIYFKKIFFNFAINPFTYILVSAFGIFISLRFLLGSSFFLEQALQTCTVFFSISASLHFIFARTYFDFFKCKKRFYFKIRFYISS